VLKKEHLNYLKEVFKETMENLGGELIEFDGESDHIHLLIQYPPKHSIALIVNTLKGRSSRLLRKRFPELKKRYYGKAGLWSRSYFAGSVGGAPLEIVKQYIQNQATPE